MGLVWEEEHWLERVADLSELIEPNSFVRSIVSLLCASKSSFLLRGSKGVESRSRRSADALNVGSADSAPPHSSEELAFVKMDLVAGQ